MNLFKVQDEKQTFGKI